MCSSDLQASAKHADGMAAHVQCRLVRRAVNAHRQPTGDDKTGARQTARKRCRRVHAGARCTTTADYRQLRFFQQRGVTGDEQQRRCIVDLGEPINDAVVMDTPFVVLCKPDCRGLCPVCGANLNVEQCDCAAQAEAEWAEATENPFAALKNLKLDE